MSKKLEISASFVALSLVIIHWFVPNLRVDAITIVLFALIFLPWFLPYIKALEIPGMLKIELANVKSVTEKITSSIVQVSGKIEAKSSVMGELTVEKGVRAAQNSTDITQIWRRLAEIDPKISLIAVQIEIEKRLLYISKIFKLEAESPIAIVCSLANRQILPPNVASGLGELIALGNQAAHGAAVSQDAIEWVLEKSPAILSMLDIYAQDSDAPPKASG